MDGYYVNTLGVYLLQDSQLGTPIWSKSRSQGNQWKRAEARVSNMKNQYQIVFEALTGDSYYSVICLFLHKTRLNHTFNIKQL